jgi:predicted dithiol-disulfide oxidoreductase (DUF899 family)
MSEEQQRRAAVDMFEERRRVVLRRRPRTPRWARRCPGCLVVMATPASPVTVPCLCCQGGGA